MLSTFMTILIVIGLTAVIYKFFSTFFESKSVAGRVAYSDDELENLHNSAARVEARLDSIERIIAADNPNWRY